MLQLALIGVGAWGRNYISTISSFNDCRIKYLCAKTEKNLKSISGNYIKTTNFRKLLKYSDIDGVIIATPDSTHYQIAKEFLKRGICLLIEKPLTTKYQDSLKLKSLKNDNKSKVLVGHVYLFDPAYVKARELIKEIGPIQYLSYEILNNGPHHTNISLLWYLGPHPISLLLDIYQQEPTEVSAWALEKLKPGTGLPDLIFLNLKFSDQRQAFVKMSWLSPIKRRELMIVGKKSTIVYNDLNKNKVTYYQNHLKIIYPSHGPELPLEVELREFIEAIKKGRDIKKSNLDFAVKVTKILHLAEQSIIQGKAIHINSR